MESKKRTIDARLRAVAEEKRCPVQRCIAYVDRFLSEVMCGRCFPCALGTVEAKARLARIADGRGDHQDLAALRYIAENMQVGSLCKKGGNTAAYLLECMTYDAFAAHTEGKCSDRVCEAFIEYRIIADKCTMCGECKAVCAYNAILGMEKTAPHDTGFSPFEIREKRCLKKGDCLEVCPVGAIVVAEKPVTKIAAEAYKCGVY